MSQPEEERKVGIGLPCLLFLAFNATPLLAKQHLVNILMRSSHFSANFIPIYCLSF